VSKQIRLLPEQVGLPLLEQLGKKVFLTEGGQESRTLTVDPRSESSQNAEANTLQCKCLA